MDSTVRHRTAEERESRPTLRGVPNITRNLRVTWLRTVCVEKVCTVFGLPEDIENMRRGRALGAGRPRPRLPSRDTRTVHTRMFFEVKHTL